MKYILVNILLNFIKKERKDMSNHKLMDKYNPKEFEENLYNEWEKKGFKSVDEVDSYLKKKEVNNPKQELFDYNWLEDEE